MDLEVKVMTRALASVIRYTNELSLNDLGIPNSQSWGYAILSQV